MWGERWGEGGPAREGCSDVTYLEGSHYRSLKLGSAALSAVLTESPGSDWCNRTHFQMRIFLVFGCQDERTSKMVRKMAVLHPQMAKLSCLRPPAGAMGIRRRLRRAVMQVFPPHRPKSPKRESSPESLFLWVLTVSGPTRLKSADPPRRGTGTGWLGAPPRAGPSGEIADSESDDRF